ncbi:probable cytochrome P450 4aa1 isoform X2 [Apis cerana]|uniref:probable cytochrome P450 4aa1 isoform X2 n=1 Tax=Apis cerana TaxID=7461 RepID=UPI0007E2BC6F|nr:probable cytochrome P450 4aa1 isoform X2 [Apis cerana]XP_061933719.1 probable cytochrome P450 4aa1 isoform X2 [Apis cerana]
MVLLKWEHTPGEAWVYLVILTSIYILYILRTYIRSVIYISQLNGPKTMPIIGNANSILKENFLYRLAYESQMYGRIVRIWLTIFPYVMFLEPEDIQLILNNAKHTQKVFFYKLLDNFLGKGLITRDIKSWRIHRRLLQPAFHLHVLEKFTNTFAKHADHLMNKILEKNNQEINITTFINDSVYNILSETVLGINRINRINEMDDLPFRKGQIMLLYRMIRPWLLIEWIYRLTKYGREEEKQRKDLFDTCFKLVKEKRDLLQNKDHISNNDIKKNKNISLLEYMVEINEKNPCFSDEDIVEECCTFMLAGQDSVGTAIAMTIFLLANHPKWQNKCIEEIDEIFNGDTRFPTISDLKEMKCLEMCIKESLRLYPSVPIIGRILGEDIKIGKHIIPAGCSVLISPYSTHHLPHHFPDPDAFKPERFSPENSEKRHPYAYIPFSAGPRNCIGYKFAMLEMKSIISAILRRCRLQSIPGKKEIRPKFRMTIRAQGGLWVKIIERDQILKSIAA